MAGGSREGGNTSKGTGGKRALRKGKLKRNLRIKREEEESKLGFYQDPVPTQRTPPASGEFGANYLGRTRRRVTPRRSGQHSVAQGRPLSCRREGRLVMGHSARSREGV